MNKKDLKSLIRGVKWELLAVRLIASVLFADTVLLFSTSVGYDSAHYPASISLSSFLVYTASAFFVLLSLKIIVDSFPSDEWALFIFALGYVFITLLRKNDFYLSLGITAGFMLVLWYLFRGDKLWLKKLRLSKRTAIIIVAVLGISFTLFVGITTAFRYLSYRSPNYDFGIFSQMFYSMRETGLPMVSSERDRLLSHFAVHVSPIFYLLLPGFMIFPTPAYLEIAQALMLASGLIPLYLICRERKLSPWTTVVISFCYAAYPALAGGCYYDLHENKFLTPLILWLFYFIEKDKTLWICIFSVLTLLVKEDAAVYVACIALYIFFGKKKYIKGAGIFLGSVIYFAGVVSWLNKYGDGIMTYRYKNFIANPDDGLLGVIKTIAVNPVYLFHECFTPEKVQFMVLMLLPLGLLPLVNKKYSQFLLLIPMVLINLMSDYQYQHSIYFQYTYGVTAILFYLAAVNLSEYRGGNKYGLLALMAASAMVFSVAELPRRAKYIESYFSNREIIETFNDTLSGIPEEASVKASTFLIPHLADREILYEVTSANETEYVIFDDRPDYREEKRDILEAEYLSRGYEVSEYHEGAVLVLKKCG